MADDISNNRLTADYYYVCYNFMIKEYNSMVYILHLATNLDVMYSNPYWTAFYFYLLYMHVVHIDSFLQIYLYRVKTLLAIN